MKEVFIVIFQWIGGYTSKLFEAKTYKLIGGSLTSLFLYLIGGMTTAFQVMVILWGVDFIVGFMKAVKQKNVSSSEMRAGLFKIISYCLAVITINLLNMIVLEETGVDLRLAAWAASFIAFSEGVSILENLEELDVPLPDFLVRFLRKYTDEINNRDLDSMPEVEEVVLEEGLEGFDEDNLEDAISNIRDEQEVSRDEY